MKNNDIFYSLSINDIQTVAKEKLERNLTAEEVEKVIELVPERIAWYDIISDAIQNCKLKRSKEKFF
jgi:hypothetical protein